MNLKELEKGTEIIRKALNVVCEEELMSSNGCQDCPFYNDYAEMPCELARFGFPLVDELEQYIKESKECIE